MEACAACTDRGIQWAVLCWESAESRSPRRRLSCSPYPSLLGGLGRSPGSSRLPTCAVIGDGDGEMFRGNSGAKCLS